MSSTEHVGVIEIRNASGGTDAINDPLAGVIASGVLAGASDIHVDPTPEGFTIRMRVDGVIHTHQRIDEKQGNRLLNQVKIASQMELEHARHPQEGQFEYRDPEGQRRDMRATIVPTLGRETAHLRLLMLPGEWRDIGDLGLSDVQHEQVDRVLAAPQGLVLVAGVTGSGKTTTQYALARSYDLENHIAVSIEDPVEFDVPNLRQIDVDEARGFHMADGLRVLLRMDPDIMLVGEVRDRESAATTAHAALGGRLVLATVHARDAAAAIDAMHFRAVPYYILGGALRMVIVQNLVRKLCPHCARVRPIQNREKVVFERFHIDPPAEIASPVGCDACHDHGYVGRTGVFEVAVIDDEMAEFLSTGPHQQQIRRRFHEAGTQPLVVSVLQKVANRVTAFEEVLRLHSRDLEPTRAVIDEA